MIVAGLSRSLARRLGFGPQPYSWFFLTDPAGVVRFSVPQPVTRDTMRQLAEEYLVGSIDYGQPSRPQGLVAGASLPGITLLPVRKGAATTLATLCRPNCTVLLLRAQCSECEARNMLNLLAAVQPAMRAHRLIAVFSSSFDRVRLAAIARADGLASGGYVASGPIGPWEDAGVAGVSSQSVLIMITVRSDRVRSVTPVQDVLASWESARQTGYYPLQIASRRFGAEVDLPPSSASSQAFSSIPLRRLPPSVHPQFVPRVQDLFGLVANKGALYALDRGNDRVLVISPDGTVVRQLGEIGQGRGQLYDPVAVSVANGRAAVVDLGNSRIGVMQTNGRVASSFRIGQTTYTAALTPDGDIETNSPVRGFVVTAYSPAGRIVREFGERPPSAYAFPGRAGEFPGPALGRARLVVGPRGSTYVVFNFLPVIQKYSRAGALLWQVRLRGPVVSPVVGTFWGLPGAPSTIAVENLDGRELSDITTAACPAPGGGVVAVLGDRSLAWVSANGRQVRYWRAPSHRGGPFLGLAVLGAASSARRH